LRENETTLFENRPITSGLDHINENSFSGRAGNLVRTDDLLITDQLVHQSSYAGFGERAQKEQKIPYRQSDSARKGVGPEGSNQI
jgi:hypothetical protein